MHSRLALKSRGMHHYYAFRKLQDEPDLETLTNVQVHTGNQLYNKGKTVQVHSAAYLQHKGQKVRFGFEFLDGLSHFQDYSTANKNAFSVDGKLYKLGVMHITEGFSHDWGINTEIKQCEIRMAT